MAGFEVAKEETQLAGGVFQAWALLAYQLLAAGPPIAQDGV